MACHPASDNSQGHSGWHHIPGQVVYVGKITKNWRACNDVFDLIDCFCLSLIPDKLRLSVIKIITGP